MNEPFFVNVEMKGYARLCAEWGDYRERYESVLEASNRADQDWRRVHEGTLTELREAMTAHETLRQGLHEALELDTTLSDADLLARLREALVKPEPLTLVDTSPTCWCGARVAYEQIDATSIEYWARTGGRKYIDGPSYCTANRDHDPNLPPKDQVIPEKCWCGAPVWVHETESTAVIPPNRTHKAMIAPREFECSADGSHNPLHPPPGDGPATETMPPVVEPPTVPHPYGLGRRFVRGDTVPDEVLELVEPQGHLWMATAETGPDPSGFRLFRRAGHDARFSASALLHMKGTMWELIDSRAGEVSDEEADYLDRVGAQEAEDTEAREQDKEVRDGD